MLLLSVSRLRQSSLNKCLKTAVLYLGLNSAIAVGAPGAHGPDGEHLDTQLQMSTQNPKFETFTETFELVGELTEYELAIYLHDYRSNIPVANAMIEIEVGAQAVEATYEAADNYYAVTQESFLHAFESPGEYPVILTIMTEDAADLMEATFIVPEASSHQQEHGHGHEELQDQEHEKAHYHDHVSWWPIPLAILCFLAGYLVNKRQNRGAKA